MKVGDLVVDSVGRCGLVVYKERPLSRVYYLVIFGERVVRCLEWEFRVLDS